MEDILVELKPSFRLVEDEIEAELFFGEDLIMSVNHSGAAFTDEILVFEDAINGLLKGFNLNLDLGLFVIQSLTSFIFSIDQVPEDKQIKSFVFACPIEESVVGEEHKSYLSVLANNDPSISVIHKITKDLNVDLNTFVFTREKDSEVIKLYFKTKINKMLN